MSSPPFLLGALQEPPSMKVETQKPWQDVGPAKRAASALGVFPPGRTSRTLLLSLSLTSTGPPPTFPRSGIPSCPLFLARHSLVWGEALRHAYQLGAASPDSPGPAHRIVKESPPPPFPCPQHMIQTFCTSPWELPPGLTGPRASAHGTPSAVMARPGLWERIP